MLQIKKITKTFGNIVALSNVSFEVKDKEFVFLTGPSGSGKTTLIRLILGEIKPDAGEIVLNGQKVFSLPERQIPFYRQKIGVVFQDFKLLGERTVRENIEVALAILGLSKEEWASRVNHVLKLVGLENRADLFPSQLSGGEIQRASLARALVIDPKIILADEPTGNLDWKVAEDIFLLLDKINKEGKTVVVATHNRNIIKKLAKKEIKLNKGKIVES